jgi:hypothetical protein
LRCKFLRFENFFFYFGWKNALAYYVQRWRCDSDVVGLAPAF